MNPSLNKPLIELFFDAANIRRWNDQINPMEFTELDKQAHKMIIAWVLAKCEEDGHSAHVDWKKLNGLEILGAQSEAKNVNFATMRGVYILHYGQEIIYVGQAISNDGIGKRLRDHTRDRLANRWNKFSWFGLDSVDSDGRISKSSSEDFQLSIQSIADVLEGMLLEILEPKSNRRGGNGFSNNDKSNDGDLELGEYSQIVDESIEKEHFRSMVNKYLSTKQ